jgi:ferrous-iron efflux pump FieF
MDKEWPSDKRMRLIEIASRCPGFVNLHDLRTRTSGAHDFAQFHIWVDPKMTIEEAHIVVECLEKTIEEAFPGIEVLVHVDPHGQIDTNNPLVEADQFALLKDG